MHDDRHARMLEATRLTRAGRLAEATALLRGAPGQASPTATTEDGDGRMRGADAARTIDATAETIEVTVPRAHRGAAAGDAAGARPGRPAGAAWRARPPGVAEPEAARPDAGGGRFIAGSYRNEAGSRAYKLFVPSGHHGQPVPLVVMLHGCTQGPDDFAAGTGMNLHAEARTCLVAYPAQDGAANAQRCWNWFDPGHQQRGRGEPGLIAGIVREVMRDHAVDRGRVYVAGLSAGGAAAAVIAATYPDLVAAVGVHSGLPCGAAHDIPSALSAMRQGAPASRGTAGGGARRLVPTIVFHGDRDTTVHPRNADVVVAQARAADPAALQATAMVERGQVAGGRGYSRRLHADASGTVMLEQWVVHGLGHAWSGGSPAGSYTDPQGPDAAREMLRFFLEHPHPAPSTPA